MKKLILAFTGLIILTLSTSAQLFNSDLKDNCLLIKGTAILKQTPEIISASISIKSESKDYSICQDMLYNQLGRITALFLKQNISKDLIRTNEITINEKIDYIDGRETHNGFSGNITLIIESDYSPKFAKDLINVLKADTSFSNYSISFKLSEEQKSKLRAQAITLAIDDAKEKATLIAKTLNIKLIKINSISYLNEGPTWIIDRDIIKEVIEPSKEIFANEGSESNSTIDFNPKEIKIFKTVEIEWIIEDNSKMNQP